MADGTLVRPILWRQVRCLVRGQIGIKITTNWTLLLFPWLIDFGAMGVLTPAPPTDEGPATFEIGEMEREGDADEEVSDAEAEPSVGCCTEGRKLELEFDRDTSLECGSN